MDWTKPEVLIALSAAVISAGALLTSIASVIFNHRHNRLILRPKLSFDFLVRPGSPIASVDLVNRGMGPAHIERFVFHIDNQPPGVAGLQRFEDVTEYLELPSGTVLSLLTPPESMAIGERIQLIAVPMPSYTPALAKKVQAGFRRVRYSVEYHATDGGEAFKEVGDGMRAFPPETVTPGATPDNIDAAKGS